MAVQELVVLLEVAAPPTAVDRAMIFHAPPNRAAQALLEQGSTSQRVEPRRRKPHAATRTSSPRPALRPSTSGPALGSSVPTPAPPLPAPASEKRRKSNASPIAQRKKPPDELTLINQRVEKLIDGYVGPDTDNIKYADDGSVIEEPDLNDLKVSIKYLLGQHVDQSVVRTMALENVVSAIGLYGDDDAGPSESKADAMLQQLEADGEPKDIDNFVDQTW